MTTACPGERTVAETSSVRSARHKQQTLVPCSLFIICIVSIELEAKLANVSLIGLIARFM